MKGPFLFEDEREEKKPKKELMCPSKRAAPTSDAENQNKGQKKKQNLRRGTLKEVKLQGRFL